MSLFDLAAWLIIVAAVFSYLNQRFVRAPRAIGLLIGGLVGALALSAVVHWLPNAHPAAVARNALVTFSFPAFLLNGVLGFIVFAGALDIDIQELRSRRATVLVLATVGVLLSTLFVGYGTYGILRLSDRPLPLIHCLLFGALISPTDPVAVLAIMRELPVAKRLQVEIAGESLFNDGIAIVVFTILASAAASPAQGAVGLVRQSVILFLREGVGGVAVGAVLAFAVYRVLKSIDAPNIEVLMSVALVAAIALTSRHLALSAPLGCAAAGLVIGHRARQEAMQEATQRALDTLWSFIDSVLNALLFFLLGIQALAVGVPPVRQGAVIGMIVVLVILARFPAVWMASKCVPGQRIGRRAIAAFGWGGLRGGVSVALALSLPSFPGRDLILAATYATVLVSLLGQGLTVSALLRRLGLRNEDDLRR